MLFLSNPQVLRIQKDLVLLNTSDVFSVFPLLEHFSKRVSMSSLFLFTEAMLDKLDGRAPAMTPTTMPMENPAEAQASQAAPNGNGVDSHGINTENGNSPTNPIGSLQEYCVKYSLPMPIFDLGHNSGHPNQRFVIVGKVGQYMSAGYGKSKNDAKREAAVTLLEELKELGGNFNVTVQANEGSGSAHVGNDKVITIDEDEPTLKKRRI